MPIPYFLSPLESGRLPASAPFALAAALAVKAAYQYAFSRHILVDNSALPVITNLNLNADLDTVPSAPIVTKDMCPINPFHALVSSSVCPAAPLVPSEVAIPSLSATIITTTPTTPAAALPAHINTFRTLKARLLASTHVLITALLAAPLPSPLTLPTPTIPPTLRIKPGYNPHRHATFSIPCLSGPEVEQAAKTTCPNIIPLAPVPHERRFRRAPEGLISRDGVKVAGARGTVLARLGQHGYSALHILLALVIGTVLGAFSVVGYLWAHDYTVVKVCRASNELEDDATTIAVSVAAFEDAECEPYYQPLPACALLARVLPACALLARALPKSDSLVVIRDTTTSSAVHTITAHDLIALIASARETNPLSTARNYQLGYNLTAANVLPRFNASIIMLNVTDATPTLHTIATPDTTRYCCEPKPAHKSNLIAYDQEVPFASSESQCEPPTCEPTVVAPTSAHPSTCELPIRLTDAIPTLHTIAPRDTIGHITSTCCEPKPAHKSNLIAYDQEAPFASSESQCEPPACEPTIIASASASTHPSACGLPSREPTIVITSTTTEIEDLINQLLNLQISDASASNGTFTSARLSACDLPSCEPTIVITSTTTEIDDLIDQLLHLQISDTTSASNSTVEESESDNASSSTDVSNDDEDWTLIDSDSDYVDEQKCFVKTQVANVWDGKVVDSLWEEHEEIEEEPLLGDEHEESEEENKARVVEGEVVDSLGGEQHQSDVVEDKIAIDEEHVEDEHRSNSDNGDAEDSTSANTTASSIEDHDTSVGTTDNTASEASTPAPTWTPVRRPRAGRHEARKKFNRAKRAAIEEAMLASSSSDASSGTSATSPPDSPVASTSTLVPTSFQVPAPRTKPISTPMSRLFRSGEYKEPLRVPKNDSTNPFAMALFGLVVQEAMMAKPQQQQAPPTQQHQKNSSRQVTSKPATRGL
ncbi:hypothetical protein BDQ12DRAFT_725841 [Crucibulum laeve]|uniref:Uncharacterized protein n=1 Tax=Crucibulum laeve TaxID=68775 RepID=A0A5C3LT42_9AGAR|nr:hypothetical protein BDQ12DRAFT_725841 [Crucibulum laeve]